MKASGKKGLLALFIGYQASGKTTFLTSCVLASQLNKIPVAISEVVEEGRKPFFAERVDSLRKGKTVEKTRIDQWYDLRLYLEFEGKEGIYVQTIDFPGEIAASHEPSAGASRLSEYIASSHCLYLMFDASLATASYQSDLAFERLRGQFEAIANARRLFEDKKPENPIVVVVTKSDLLFKDQSSEQVTRQLNELNKDNKLATKKFRELYKSHANILLKSKPQKPIKICYVASLGASPKQIKQNDDHQDNVNYVIGDLRAWQPIGLLETLKSGLFSGIKAKEGKRPRQVIRKLRPIAIGVLIVFFSLTLLAIRDYQAYNELERLLEQHNSGSISAERVLNKLDELYSQQHPFIYLPGDRLVFIPIPDWQPATRVRRLYEQFSKETLISNLKVINSRSESLAEDLMPIIYSFESLNGKLKQYISRYEQLIEKTKVIMKKINNPDTVKFFQKEVLQPTKVSLASVIKQAIPLLWRSAELSQLELKDAESYIGDMVVKLQKMNEQDPPSPDIPQLAGEAVVLYEKSRCTFMLNKYKTGIEKSPGEHRVNFQALAGVCTDCRDAELKSDVCEQLTNYAAQWDNIQAKQIRELFTSDAQNLPDTREPYDMFRQYLQDLELRRRWLPSSTGVYEQQARKFIKWHDSLNKLYYINTIRLTINKDTGFVRYQEGEIELRDSAEDDSKIVTAKKAFFEPKGDLKLYINNIQLIKSYFEGFDYTIHVSKQFRWKPGDEITIILWNQDSQQKRTWKLKGYYNLPRLAWEGFKTPEAELYFDGLNIEPMPSERD